MMTLRCLSISTLSRSERPRDASQPLTRLDLVSLCPRRSVSASFAESARLSAGRCFPFVFSVDLPSAGLSLSDAIMAAPPAAEKQPAFTAASADVVLPTSGWRRPPSRVPVDPEEALQLKLSLHWLPALPPAAAPPALFPSSLAPLLGVWHCRSAEGVAEMCVHPDGQVDSQGWRCENKHAATSAPVEEASSGTVDGSAAASASSASCRVVSKYHMRGARWQALQDRGDATPSRFLRFCENLTEGKLLPEETMSVHWAATQTLPCVSLPALWSHLLPRWFVCVCVRSAVRGRRVPCIEINSSPATVTQWTRATLYPEPSDAWITTQDAGPVSVAQYTMVRDT